LSKEVWAQTGRQAALCFQKAVTSHQAAFKARARADRGLLSGRVLAFVVVDALESLPALLVPLESADLCGSGLSASDDSFHC